MRENDNFIRWLVVCFSVPISCVLGVVFYFVISIPGLGDGGMRPVRWFHYLALLPAAAYALLAIVAVWFPRKRYLAPALVIGLACFAPNIGVCFMMHPLAGLIMTAVLILSLLYLYSFLRRSVNGSFSEDKEPIQTTTANDLHPD